MVYTLHDTTGPPPASPLRHDYNFVQDDARRLTEARLERSGGHLLHPEDVYWRRYAFDPTDDWNLSSVVDLVSGTTTSYGYDSALQDGTSQIGVVTTVHELRGWIGARP